MAPAYTSRDEDIYVGQRQLLRQGCLGRTKLHGFVVGVEKVLRTLYNIEYISKDVVMCTEQALRTDQTRTLKAEEIAPFILYFAYFI